MMEIGDVVELVVDIPTEKLRAGMQGTVVLLHGKDAAEVEFIDEDGETQALLALEPTQFIVAWRISTKTWVPIAERTANLVAILPEDAAHEVLDFARFLKTRARESLVA